MIIEQRVALPAVTLNLSLSVPTTAEPSPNVLHVAAMFGLGLDSRRDLQIIPPVKLDLRPGQIVFITGPSGSGKSSLLRLIAHALHSHPAAIPIHFDNLQPPADLPLVDCFPNLPLHSTLQLLALAGLADAFVLLRKPSQLSDGQRYRLRLAQAMALSMNPNTSTPPPNADSTICNLQSAICNSSPSSLNVMIADEFTATLDRLTASVIAKNIRRWTRKQSASSTSGGACFIAATTHDDLLEHLDPDTLIEKPLGQGLHIATKDPSHAP